LYALNEEYNNQLLTYRSETIQTQKYYEEEIKQKELETHQQYLYLQPEMIPPDQTLKLFVCNEILYYRLSKTFKL
jgi:hypothetical protein